MEICSVESTRQKLEFGYNTRCMDTNTPILEELVRLRAEQAALLGYPTHAAYVLEIRMAQSPDVVGPFLRELSAKLQPLADEELAYWRELKAEEARAAGDADATAAAQVIQPWDVRYLTRLSELKKYKVDDQKIKKYFPLSVVTTGLLDIYQRTLGFVFEEVADRAAHAVWHEDVQLFRVKDADSGKVRGYFYLDLVRTNTYQPRRWARWVLRWSGSGQRGLHAHEPCC
jgi:Zn-dependent oligopeptidase